MDDNKTACVCMFCVSIWRMWFQNLSQIHSSLHAHVLCSWKLTMWITILVHRVLGVFVEKIQYATVFCILFFFVVFFFSFLFISFTFLFLLGHSAPFKHLGKFVWKLSTEQEKSFLVAIIFPTVLLSALFTQAPVNTLVTVVLPQKVTRMSPHVTSRG